ncbi:Uncharacterized protein Fot_12654 [Forsythia ovata]|uniref:Uncharacterized protein n=1 Tax=Forsythia ovata TaxID=205694 RepID=A0ABD1WN77_9LAMI
MSQYQETSIAIGRIVAIYKDFEQIRVEICDNFEQIRVKMADEPNGSNSSLAATKDIDFAFQKECSESRLHGARGKWKVEDKDQAPVKVRFLLFRIWPKLFDRFPRQPACLPISKKGASVPLHPTYRLI